MTHSMNVVFAYLAPAKALPVTSALLTVVGVVLTFGRGTLRLVARWVRPVK